MTNVQIIILLVILTILIGIYLHLKAEPWMEKRFPVTFYPSLIIEQNFLRANVDPVYYETQVLATLIDRIIQCESGGNPNICNKQYGCSAGQGLFQLIPSTVKYCEKKLNRSINPFNIDDNTACAMWLLENEGTKHWNQSKHCWDK